MSQLTTRPILEGMKLDVASAFYKGCFACNSGDPIEFNPYKGSKADSWRRGYEAMGLLRKSKPKGGD